MNERLNAIVGARIGEFRRKMAEARAIAAAFPKEIVTRVRAVGADLGPGVKEFEGRMDKLAGVYRDMNVIFGEALKGSLLASIPALTALIPGLTAVIATAGVQIGVLTGGLMGMASSFGVAAVAAVGLGAFMVPMVNNLSEAVSAVKSGDKSLSDFSGTMRQAISATINLQDQFTKTRQAMEPAAYGAMAGGMDALRLVIEKTQTGLVRTAEAAQGLMESLVNTIKTAPDVAATFEWFNSRGPEAFSNWGKIAGYAIRGTLNLLRAFDPLAQTVETGLLNMTKRFSEWAAGLGKSEKFQKFIAYVQENGPKLTAVIGNIITGIVNMFAAFGPLAADMMTGFQNMTERFKEWSATLGENQGFKNFVSFIRENGPQMIELIGNVVTFLIEMGKGFAQVGAAVLPVINNIISWMNTQMQANSNVAKSIAVMTMLFGVFKAFAPALAALQLIFRTAFSVAGQAISMFAATVRPYLTLLMTQLMTFGTRVFDVMYNKVGAVFMNVLRGKFIPFVTQFGTYLQLLITKVVSFAARFGQVFLRIGLALTNILAKTVWWAARMAAQWVIAMGPVGWVIAAVVALVAIIILNWDKIVAWTQQTWSKVWNFIKTAWTNIKTTVSTYAQALWAVIVAKFQQIVSAIQQKMQQAWSFIKSVWSGIKSTVSSAAQSIWSAVSSKFQQIVSTIRDKMQSAWSTIKSTWSNIKNTVTTTASNILSTVRDKFQQMVSNVREKMQSIWTNIQQVWEQIKSTITEKIQAAVQSVKDKFEEMRSAVSDKIEAAKELVSNGVEAIKSFFDNLNLYDSGKAIIQSAIDGIEAMKDKIVGKVEDIVSSVRDLWPFSPAKTGPLSDIHRMDFGGPISKSIDRMKPEVNRAMYQATSGLRSAINVGAAIDTPKLNTVSSVTASTNNFAPDIPTDYEREEGDIYLQADGRTIAQVLRPHNQKLDRTEGSFNVALNKLSAT